MVRGGTFELAESWGDLGRNFKNPVVFLHWNGYLESMMCTARIFSSLAVVGVLVNSATGATADNPYERIIARNLFGLKDPPPPAPPVSDKPPTPAITLQGFTTILGKNQVLFKVALPARPPQPASEISKILAEGDSEDEISVLEINLVDRSVKFDNHGSVEVKNIKDHAAKPAGSPVTLAGGVPQPAAPGLNVGSVTPPPAFAANTATPGGTAGLSSRASALQNIPTRQTRANANTTTTTTPYGMVTTQNPTPQPGQNWPPERTMTPEEQEILIEVERERNKNNPNYPPLPPTSITPNPTPAQPRSQ